MLKRELIISNVGKFLCEDKGNCVLRKADLIFESSISDDIDLLLSEKTNSKLWNYLKSVGFKKKIDSKFSNIYLYGSKPHTHYINVSLDLHFDCVTGIFHRSLHSLKYQGFAITYWLPLDKLIQEESRKNHTYLNIKNIKIPCLSQEVELVHLIAHVILDKKGYVKPYYRNRVKYLINNVNLYHVERMMRLVFFNFTTFLLKNIKNDRFETLFEDYKNFKGY